MPAPVRYWAKRPFGYAGTQLDRGQVFEFVGALNDDKLRRLNYVGEVAPKAALHTCAECGAEFVGIPERTAHGRDRHGQRPLTPHEEDARGDSRERMLNEVAPLGGGLAT